MRPLTVILILAGILFLGSAHRGPADQLTTIDHAAAAAGAAAVTVSRETSQP